jgi:GT2 family glycosyltransferase
MTKIKISIILLNYNGADDTLECLRSLFSVSYSHFDIIIVDNKSTDDSVIKIQRFLLSNGFLCSKSGGSYILEGLTIKLIKSDHNGGYGCGNNIGIKSALEGDTDYVLILNNDTEVESDFIQPLLEIAVSDSNIGIVGNKILYHSDKSNIWFNGGSFSPLTARLKHFDFNKKNINQECSEKVTFITGCLWLIPRKVFVDVGYINEKYFMYVEDFEYCYRVQKKGFKLKIANTNMVSHKVGGVSEGHVSAFSIYWKSRNKIRFAKEYFSFPNNVIAISEVAIFQSIRWIYKGKMKLLLSNLHGTFDGLRK